MLSRSVIGLFQSPCHYRGDICIHHRGGVLIFSVIVGAFLEYFSLSIYACDTRGILVFPAVVASVLDFVPISGLATNACASIWDIIISAIVGSTFESFPIQGVSYYSSLSGVRQNLCQYKSLFVLPLLGVFRDPCHHLSNIWMCHYREFVCFFYHRKYLGMYADIWTTNVYINIEIGSCGLIFVFVITN